MLLASSIKYTDQWEKAVLLRLGRYRGLRGPGYFAIVPILDRVAYTIDQRIRTTAFGAESCLTRDTVPVNVDAIAFWIVRDAERAALEVQDYDEAVILSAQTALRDAIGKHDLAELIQSRVELGHGLKVALEQKMANWGIQVQSVEIRDVIIPAALEDAMSRQAQAERERQARIILGTAETEIAHKFVEAAERLSRPARRDEPARDEHALREHRQARLADGGAVGAGRFAERAGADGNDGSHRIGAAGWRGQGTGEELRRPGSRRGACPHVAESGKAH